MPFAPITVPELRARSAAYTPAAQAHCFASRSLDVGPLWMRCENHDTLLWHLAETIHNEGVDDEALLQAECDVFNTLVPPGACLFTVGMTQFEAAAWGSLVPTLSQRLSITCRDAALAPSAVVPSGDRCQVLFTTPSRLRQLLRDPLADMQWCYHLPQQTFAVRVPRALQNALLEELS